MILFDGMGFENRLFFMGYRTRFRFQFLKCSRGGELGLVLFS